MEYCEEIEDIEPSALYLLRKSPRKIRRNRNVLHNRRLFLKLKTSQYYKPSIWAEMDWDEEKNRYVYNGRVKRSKSSKIQKCLKKQSNKIFRRAPNEDIKTKGNQYRKHFDYWWIWI